MLRKFLMTNGVLLFAHNNQKMDYVKQAIYCARKIKKYLNLPVALVTDSKGYLQKRYQQHACLFEYIIENKTSSNQTRKFRNGYSTAVLPWNNFSRCESYDITPFKNTLVIDTDFLLGNNNLLKCFESNTFKISKNIIDLNPQRNDTTIQRVSDTTIDMYWATVFYFSKNKFSEMFFNLVKHIRDNWNFYRLQYQIVGNNFRNDYAFSIALNLLGYPQEDLPCKMFFTTDADNLLEIDKEKYKFLISTTNFTKSNTVCSIENVNIHIMNKFNLGEQIDKVLNNE